MTSSETALHKVLYERKGLLKKIVIARHGQHVSFRVITLDFFPTGALSPISLKKNKVIQIPALFCFPDTSFLSAWTSRQMTIFTMFVVLFVFI